MRGTTTSIPSLEGMVLSQLGDVEQLVELPEGRAVSVKDALAAAFWQSLSFLRIHSPHHDWL